MIPATSIIGLAACGFVAVCTGLGLIMAHRRSLPIRIFIALALVMLMFIPVDGLILAGYVRGVIGDPSITTLLLMLCIGYRQVAGRELFDRRNFGATMALILLAACFLYPMAMGLGRYDPYALGFGSWPFYATLLGIALLAWWRNLPLIVLCIVLSAAAFAAGMSEATNLWNYLIDPIAVVLALGWMIGTLVSLLAERRRSARAVAS